jgi:hypothetical protein
MHEKFVVVKLKGQLEKEFISITASLKKKMESNFETVGNERGPQL